MNCPNCGAVYDSYHPFCQNCGTPLSDESSIPSACEKLAADLQAIEVSKPVGILASVSKIASKVTFNGSSIDEYEKKKIDLISGFVCPNTKVELLAFLDMAEAKIKALEQSLIHSTKVKEQSTILAVQGVWKEKYQQVYDQASHVLINDEDFLKIKREKESKERKEKQDKEKAKKQSLKILVGMFVAGLILMLIGSLISLTKEKDTSFSDQSSGIPVSIHIECVPNLMFSKYDIQIKIDDEKFKRVEHGTSNDLTAYLSEGTHVIGFYEAGTTPLKGSVEFTAEEGTKLSYKLTCYEDYISIVDLNDTEEDTSDSTVSEKAETEKETKTTTESTKKETTTKARTVSYFTGTLQESKKGNSGKYAYVASHPAYDVYYVIDFDEGYIYYFCDGNGDETCAKAKIESGDLNTCLIVTYRDGSDVWQEGLHFKWVKQPDHLVVEDRFSEEFDYYTADLEDALKEIKSRDIMKLY